jgi:hypothetical protein
VYPPSSTTDIGAIVHDGNRRAATLTPTDPSAAPATSCVSNASA